MFLSLCLSVASPGQLHRLPWLSCFVSSNCLLCQLMKLICPNRCKRDLFCSARGQCSDQWTQDHTHRRTNTRSTASMALAELATQREMREKRRTKRVNAARHGSPSAGCLDGWIVTGDSIVVFDCVHPCRCVRTLFFSWWASLARARSRPAFICSDTVRAEM